MAKTYFVTDEPMSDEDTYVDRRELPNNCNDCGGGLASDGSCNLCDD